MKTLISILIAISFYTSALAKHITVTVVFENLTEKTTVSGQFYIAETNEHIEIHSLETFSITLPKEGKYQFRFYSEDVHAFTSYPVTITERKNIVTIRLENKKADVVAFVNTPIKDISSLSMAQIEAGGKNGTINFIHHGLLPVSPEAITAFKNTYGVGFITENCVVDPISFKTATTTNKKIEAYLTLKFGEAWRSQLPAQPFGL